jgi:hypothetical protein
MPVVLSNSPSPVQLNATRSTSDGEPAGEAAAQRAADNGAAAQSATTSPAAADVSQRLAASSGKTLASRLESVRQRSEFSAASMTDLASQIARSISDQPTQAMSLQAAGLPQDVEALVR